MGGKTKTNCSTKVSISLQIEILKHKLLSVDVKITELYKVNQVFFPVQYCSFKTFHLPLPGTLSLLKTVKIYHCLKLPLKSTYYRNPQARPSYVLALQFGLRKIEFEINHKYRN